jgi:hypothetical protein
MHLLCSPLPRNAERSPKGNGAATRLLQVPIGGHNARTPRIWHRIRLAALAALLVDVGDRFT